LDGQRISREIDHAPGFAARPMNRDEVERKFRGNVGQHWEKDRTDKILQALWALERTNNVSSLLAELALPA
jgi:2-methylcitrate dehydratase